MICKHYAYLIELNKQRVKKGLRPLSRRQFCKLAAASSAALGLSALAACSSDDSSGDESDGGQAAGGSGGTNGEEDGGSDYVKRTLGQDTRAEIEVRPDVELDDYSGPFRPDLKLTDFTREQLSRMFLMYHQYDLDMIKGYSMAEMAAAKASGSTSGENMQVVVWSNDLAEVARSVMMKYLKTSGSGIDSFLKAVQVDITAQPPNFDNDFEMLDENTGIYTFNKCVGIEMVEDVASEEQIKDICALDPPAIGNSCDMYSRGLEGKKIELEIVTMPPRAHPDEVYCQWKFTYVPA